MNDNECVDCGAFVTGTAKRCRKCSHKRSVVLSNAARRARELSVKKSLKIGRIEAYSLKRRLLVEKNKLAFLSLFSKRWISSGEAYALAKSRGCELSDRTLCNYLNALFTNGKLVYRDKQASPSGWTREWRISGSLAVP